MSRRALTLLEILIALVILAVIMAGLTNLFISGKRWILHARARMAGGEIGKQFLDPLQMQVRQDQWPPVGAGNCLSRDGINPAGCITAPWRDPSNNQVSYTPQYRNTSQGNLRKVMLTVSWPEINPNESP